MHTKAHWDRVYTEKHSEQVSWYRPHLDTSLGLIERFSPDRTAALIDIGAGASTLVDDLLSRGYSDITALDTSSTALNIAARRLEHAATQVHWLEQDVCEPGLPADRYHLWHDRAVFHFLLRSAERALYVAQAAASLKPRGYAIVSTLGSDGPERCSGLKTVRYTPDTLLSEFRAHFRLERSQLEWHTTPSATTQQFLYCVLQKM
ncbi:MAG: class I SAM-dependent methyltransferase [Acidobacteriaceae bacterium]